MPYGICIFKIEEQTVICLLLFIHSFLTTPSTVTEELALNEEVYRPPAAALSVARLSNVCDQDKTDAFPWHFPERKSESLFLSLI